LIFLKIQHMKFGEELNSSNNQYDFLAGGGEMGKRIQAMDWSKTQLGPIESWSQSLRTTVSLCLASNFPICLVWGPGHVQIYNDGYIPICGALHPQALGQDFTEVWAEAMPVVGEAFHGALAGKASYVENQRMFVNRYDFVEEIFVTFSFSPIRDETGGVGGVFHPLTEQTSKMLSERRTKAMRDLAAWTGKAKTMESVFTFAAETLSDYELDLPFGLFYTLDQEGMQAQLVASTGLAPDTPASPTLVDLQAPASWPLAEVINSGVGVQVDKLEDIFGPLSCGSYPESPAKALVLPISSPGAERPCAVFVAGVSPRLALNEVYRGFYDLLVSNINAAVANAQAYEEERKRAEALAEIDRAKTAFFSNVSHEFRTPLTLMLGPIEDVLAKGEQLPENRELLTVAHRNGLRLQKLVNTLLDFSRIEAGRIQASYRPTDLSPFTAELASNFRSAMEKAGLKLRVDCPSLPEPLYVDRDMWEKIILNLLSNAFKHTFEGEIKVTMQWLDERVELVVQDTGIGVPSDQLPYLFERFHRVPNARSRTHEGSGIGLALVNELVKLHGGTIMAESVLNQGTTFTVSIPTGKAHLPADRIEAETTLNSTVLGAQPFVEEALRWLPDGDRGGLDIPSVPQELVTQEGIWQGAGPGDVRKARIILADDNADMREYVHRLLSPYCEVEAVSNGKAALQAAQAHSPDLILSDVMMPEADGFELLHALRNDSALQHIPVILLSARAGEEARVEGLQAGADDYLTKPFNARELLAKVKANLELHKIRFEAAEMEKQLRLKIAQSEALFRAAFEEAVVAVTIIALDGKFLQANKASASVYGYSEKELTSLSIQEVTHPDDLAQSIEMFGRVVKGERPSFIIEKRYIRKDKAILWAKSSVALVRDEHGKPLNLVAVVEDITERKRAEENLKIKNEQLTKTNNDLDNFVYTASHDLKSPIANLEGLLTLFKQFVTDRLSEKEKNILGMMDKSVLRFKNTIQSLTEVSKVQPTLPEDMETVAFAPVLEEVKANIDNIIAESGAKIVADFKVADVKFSKKDINSILYNLVSNAIKYRSPDRAPLVSVKTEQTGNYIVLSVEDNGLGIDLKHKDKLFSMFKRLHSHVEGSGVGLYLVKRIVENNGGKVDVESELGKGTSFKVFFKSEKK
jgi:PAS domain S-box-containing protein